MDYTFRGCFLRTCENLNENEASFVLQSFIDQSPIDVNVTLWCYIVAMRRVLLTIGRCDFVKLGKEVPWPSKTSWTVWTPSLKPSLINKQHKSHQVFRPGPQFLRHRHGQRPPRAKSEAHCLPPRICNKAQTSRSTEQNYSDQRNGWHICKTLDRHMR